MNTNELSIEIKNSPSEAPVYREGWIGLSLDRAIIVKNGTVDGAATVDIQLVDEHGNKYITMTTGRIIKALAQVIAD
jgi:hypothetical protein